MTEENEYPDSEEWVSKTQRKREMSHRQVLAEKILALKPSLRDQLNLPEELISALEETKRIKKNEALRRHKQYLGKLMRDIDIEPIESFFEKLETAHQVNTRAFHDLEDLREELIAGDNKVIGSVIERFPMVDRQKLRQLVKNAKNEKKINEAQNTNDNKQGRTLFRYLRSLSEEAE